MSIIKIIIVILAFIAVAFSRHGDSPAQSNPVNPVAQTGDFPVVIRVDASSKKGEMSPIWRFFGADEPNFAYMKDGRKLSATYRELQDSAKKSCFLNE